MTHDLASAHAEKVRPHRLETLQQQFDEEAAAARTVARLRQLLRWPLLSRGDWAWSFGWAAFTALCVVVAAPPVHAQGSTAGGAAYGPADPAPPPPQWSPQDQRIRREARRTEIAFQGLNAIDAIETCYVIKSGRGHETNPLLPKSCEGIVAVKLVGGVLHYLIFDHINDRNPRQARTYARISAGVMGGVVMANLRVVF